MVMRKLGTIVLLLGVAAVSVLFLAETIPFTILFAVIAVGTLFAMPWGRSLPPEHEADAEILHRARERLDAETALRGARLDLSCRSGQVTLSGSVSSPAVKELAKEVVRQVPGVTDVSDEVRVRAA